jgi:hypothetical protein
VSDFRLAGRLFVSVIDLPPFTVRSPGLNGEKRLGGNVSLSAELGLAAEQSPVSRPADDDHQTLVFLA